MEEEMKCTIINIHMLAKKYEKKSRNSYPPAPNTNPPPKKRLLSEIMSLSFFFLNLLFS